MMVLPRPGICRLRSGRTAWDHRMFGTLCPWLSISRVGGIDPGWFSMSSRACSTQKLGRMQE